MSVSPRPRSARRESAWLFWSKDHPAWAVCPTCRSNADELDRPGQERPTRIGRAQALGSGCSRVEPMRRGGGRPHARSSTRVRSGHPTTIQGPAEVRPTSAESRRASLPETSGPQRRCNPREPLRVRPVIEERMRAPGPRLPKVAWSAYKARPHHLEPFESAGLYRTREAPLGAAVRLSISCAETLEGSNPSNADRQITSGCCQHRDRKFLCRPEELEWSDHLVVGGGASWLLDPLVRTLVSAVLQPVGNDFWSEGMPTWQCNVDG